jgi:hypothetical protein
MAITRDMAAEAFLSVVRGLLRGSDNSQVIMLKALAVIFQSYASKVFLGLLSPSTAIFAPGLSVASFFAQQPYL